MIIFCCLFMISNLKVNIYAEGTQRRTEIKSKGNLNFENGKVLVTSSDLIYLADEIDNLEKKYKCNLVDALNTIGTYFKSDGSITYNSSQNEIKSEVAKANLSFAGIKHGIISSQSIPLPYKEATADNLSANCAAWVNGVLVKGNGKDCENSWQNGYNEGYAQGIADSLDKVEVVYTYHEHTGDESQVGGCYGTLTGTKPVLCGCIQYVHTDSLGHSTCANCWHNHGANKCGGIVSYKQYEYIGLACGKTEETIESATIVY